MLRIDRDQRPRADELSIAVDRGMRIWRQDTEDGGRFIAKGEQALGPSEQRRVTTLCLDTRVDAGLDTSELLK